MLIQELYTKLKNFNTSYVVIKLRTTKLNTTLFSISIHLMLLLNLPTLATSKHETHFNTSYVVIKLHLYFEEVLDYEISIHLMLLLN